VVGSVIGTLTNTGTLSGGDHGAMVATTGTVTNAAGGLINATGLDGIYLHFGQTLTLLDNAGTISGARVGFNGEDGTTVGTLTNSGTISGGDNGVVVATSGTVTNAAGALINGSANAGVYLRPGQTLTLLDNAGTINAGGTGVYGVGGSTIGTFTNSGTIQAGGNGLNLSASGTVTNLAGALISGSVGDGIVTTGAVQRIDNAGALAGGNAGIQIFSGSVDSIDNAGLIRGDSAGVRVLSGSVLSLVNTGTIGSSGASPKVAVSVSPYGTLGDGSGASGPAIVSTAAGALLDGGIVNAGTILNGFQIGNQNVTVSAGTGLDEGLGAFNGGTLDVVDGDLTFTDGTIALNADVSVDGGAGLFTNEATLALGDSQTVTGNFTQTSAATLRTILSGSSTYGALTILGAATFAGGLDLDLSAFSLAEGQTFDLLEFASRTGEFTGLSVDGAALASLGANQWAYDSLIIQETWTDTSMSLSISAVPEPSTYAMALAGLACGGWSMFRRRKRA
jgi:hypothetical protein